MKLVTSRDNAFYKELIKLSSSARQRGKSMQTLLDGAHLLAAFLASGKQPEHLIVTEAALSNPEISALIQQLPAIPLTRFDDGLFAELSELKTVSGILALISVPQSAMQPQHSRFALLLENIQDPGNIGSMLRSAAAAGCDSVFISSGCADAWSPKVLRAAMGGHFVLEVIENADLLKIAELFNGTVFAASLQAESSLYDKRLSGNIAFAIGNEGSGLSDDLLGKAVVITIPMPGKVESLNAAAATAVCLFEAARQRQ